MKKRIIAIILSVLMLMNPVVSLAIENGNSQITPMEVEVLDDFVFDKESQTITGYNGSETDIVIPSNIDGLEVKNIGEKAFQNINLTSVIIPEGIENIGEGAFLQNSLIEVVLPGTIKNVGKMAFAANSTLKSIQLNNGLENIGEGAFLRSNIEEIEIPGSVKRIEKVAFSRNAQLKVVKLNEGLEYIGQQAFSYDTNLSGELVIPSTVHTIMTTAFSKTGVTSLTVEGASDSTKILLKSGLSDSLSKIVFKDPKRDIQINFNTFGCTEKTNNIHLGTLNVSINNVEDLKTAVEDAIKARVIGTYIKGSDEQIKEFPIIWDYASADFK